MKSFFQFLSSLATIATLTACVGDYPELPDKFQNKAPSISGLDAITLTEGSVNKIALNISDDRNEISQLDIQWTITTNPNVALDITADGDQADIDIPWLGDEHVNAVLTVTATDAEGEATQVTAEFGILKQRLLVVQAEKERQGDGDLYRVGYPEANPQRLTDPISVNESIDLVELSPTGQHLAFVRSHASEPDKLIIAETGDATKTDIDVDLLATEHIHALQWSNSGHWLAIVTATSGTSPVYRLQLLDTSGDFTLLDTVPPLLTGQAYDWSDDEASLVYHNRQSQLIWLTLTDESSHTLYDPADTGVAGAPPFTWHPDDSTLAFIGAKSSNGTKAVFIVGQDQLDETPLAISTAYGSHVVSLSALNWSPEGNYLSYLGDLQTSGVVELFSFNVTDHANGTDAGDAQVKVSGTMTSGGDVTAYLWNPAESRLAYKADQLEDGRIQLFASDADGGGNRQLTNLSGTLTDLYWGWTETGELLHGYSKFEGGLPYRITLLAIDAESQLSSQVLTDALSSKTATQALGRITLSPDRQWLAIPSFTAATQQTDIQVFNLSEQRLEKVSALNNHETDTDFSWSPNSDGILYLTLDDDDIGQRLVFQPLADLPAQEDSSLMGELAPNGTIHQFQIAR